MTDYFLHPKAREDLEEIWLYSLKHWGIIQADKYISELENHFQLLARQPFYGKRRNEIETGCFSTGKSHHLLQAKGEGDRNSPYLTSIYLGLDGSCASDMQMDHSL